MTKLLVGIYYLLLFLVPGWYSQAAESAVEPIILTEEKLVEWVYQDNPETFRIEGLKKRAAFQSFELVDDYRTRWQSEVRHQNSSEKALAFFIPTFGPSYRFSTGVQQSLPYGVEFNGQLFFDQQSTQDGSIDKATRTGVLFQLSIDLWNNFLGRIDRAELHERDLQAKKEKIKARILNRFFELEMRKLYWSLVANNEQLIFSEELLKTTRRQLKEGLERKRKFIGDKQELARYRAQVASREASLLSLKYQRESFLQQLKEALPQIRNSAVVLGPYNRAQKTAEVLSCIDQIEKQEAVPWQFTQWDEVLQIIEQVYVEKRKIARKYDNPDLTLASQVQVSGVDRGYGNSFEDFTQNGEPGYSIALMLDIPLGNAAEKTKQALIEADAAEFEAEKQQIQNRVQASHTQIVGLVEVLRQAVIKLKENNENLRISIAELNKKFRQARISVNDLIVEQDTLLQGLLNEVNANLRVIHTLLDYFKVFTEEPCPVNNIHQLAMRSSNEGQIQ